MVLERHQERMGRRRRGRDVHLEIAGVVPAAFEAPLLLFLRIRLEIPADVIVGVAR
jgi:hypothetical protein